MFSRNALKARHPMSGLLGIAGDAWGTRVHQLLADQLEAIHRVFGQIPDTLEDVWAQVAVNDEKTASRLIDRTAATRNPFDAKHSRVEDDDWKTGTSVLNKFRMNDLF
jgi:hypothetical protein